jgi:fatty-acyl-CoA synthase
MDRQVLTAAQVGDEMSRYAQAFAARGLSMDSSLALLAPNRLEVLYTTGGYMVLGARHTALHPLGSIDDHAYCLEDGQIETLVFDPSLAGRAAQLRQRVCGLKNLFSLGPCDIGEDLIALAAQYRPRPLAAPDADDDHVFSLPYTGGTTGRPKGVATTYRGPGVMAQIMTADWQWPDDIRHLVCTPLSHAGAAFIVPVLLRGGSMIVLPKFEPGAVLDAIERYRITSVMLVPTMIYALLDHPGFGHADLSSLQTVFYGASPMSPVRLQEAIGKLGPIFFQFYGQSEAPQTICVMRKEEHDPDDLARLASCGRPVPWLRVAILDDAGDEVARGEPGEICVQGPLVMKGYWNRPDETAAAFEHGWLHTGDIARESDDGFFTIVDRKKDMIVSGGFNVFPREIEDVLAAHPAVASSAVVGIPDPKWGEAVKAVVVLRGGAAATPEELVALVKQHKGSHYAPKSVDIVESIPLTAVGKPDKKALRERYWSGRDRNVG